MKKATCLVLVLFAFLLLVSSTRKPATPAAYLDFYKSRIVTFRTEQAELLRLIKQNDLLTESGKNNIRKQIHKTRLALREIDFWLRYLEPIAYRKINGPLPVEWETEVFEKFEAPYRREGRGLSLGETYLDEEDANRDTLLSLIESSQQATEVFLADSITKSLYTQQHFYLANRLYLLNLASIYTTGFDCPDTTRIIPELVFMMENTGSLYNAYERDFQSYPVTDSYKILYQKAIEFVRAQPQTLSGFDHFTFIRDYINPLYTLNAAMIRDYNIRTTSFVDYSLNRNAQAIFDKSLYRAQNGKGVFIGVDDSSLLREIRNIGKMLFFDPILSGNNKRSCASCHKPGEMFADTLYATSMAFDRTGLLSRNTPSLVNAVNYHLLMMDGKHINLESQAKEVISNPAEMACSEKEVLEKVMGCNEYKTAFKKFLKTTPQYEEVNMNHIASAMMLYYSQLSNYYSDFDLAILEKKQLDPSVTRGFNLFMGKAKCGTCHFPPQFNGTKPPFTGSEFEVIGVPADTSARKLSDDAGRYKVHPAMETQAAFRTPTIRNAVQTAPYMHNGVFRSLMAVIDFYDAGGGTGKGLHVPNQTLPSDSLKLTVREKNDIIAFIGSLSEHIPQETPPAKLPASKNKTLNNRVPGGEY